MFDPARLVFIDETSTNTAMVRLRGRAPRGERLVDYAPHGAWKTVTFVGGLRQRGMTAPFVIEGAMNGPIFLAYVKQCLVPTLKRGETVLMDNLPVHKVAGVAEAIEAAGAALIYLPKYSPDLNPIELAFSKLKAHLRKAAEHTVPRLLRRIAAQEAQAQLAEGVAADPRNEGHVGPRPRGRHSLVRSFAAWPHRESGTCDRLADRRQFAGAEGQIDDEDAKDGDAISAHGHRSPSGPMTPLLNRKQP